MIRRTLLLAGVVLLAVATPALAQPYPEDVTSDTPSVASGGTVTLSAAGFPAGTVVTFAIAGIPAGTAVADQTGVATGTFAVPAGVPQGTVTVTATGTTPTGQVITRTGSLIVAGSVVTPETPPVTTPGVGGLPVTGTASALPMVILAVLLLGVGGLALLAGRRHTAGSSVKS